MSDGELFIVGRIKDLLIVDGRNHYPDDIEATIQEITGGRAAAISVSDNQTEQTGRDRRGQEARQLRGGGAAQTPQRKARGDFGDFANAQCAGRRSGAGTARFDSNNNEWEGASFGMCSAV